VCQVDDPPQPDPDDDLPEADVGVSGDVQAQARGVGRERKRTSQRQHGRREPEDPPDETPALHGRTKMTARLAPPQGE
jgi:hypothetical protein